MAAAARVPPTEGSPGEPLDVDLLLETRVNDPLTQLGADLRAEMQSSVPEGQRTYAMRIKSHQIHG